MLTLKDKLAIVVFSGLLVLLLGGALCLVAFILAYRFGMTRLGLLTLLVSASLSCAHAPAPEVPPAPSHQLWQFVVPQEVPGSWLFCVENPHANSRFQTPVARQALVCPMDVDQLRQWVSSLRPAD